MSEADHKRRQLLEAASGVFGRYGFRKTSMQDIADAAGLSRAALYLHFKNKEDVFRSTSEALQYDALHRAQAALAGTAPFSRRLDAGLKAFMLGLMTPLLSSPHGQELFDANMTLAADVTLAVKAGFLELLRGSVARAVADRAISLDAAGLDADALADLIAAAVTGLKYAGDGPAALEQRIGRFVSLLATALACDPAR